MALWELLGLLGFCCLGEARSLWSSNPATYGAVGRDTYVLKSAYPVGNGKMGVMQFGDPGAEKLNLNVDSLWSGGPFETNDYTGGNPTTDKSQYLPDIRASIFANGTGDVSKLLGSKAYYGSNQVLGNMTIELDGISTYSNYSRTLDLETGVQTVKFVANGASHNTTVFCSFPDQVCVYKVATSGTLPTITLSLENLLMASNLTNVTCDDGQVHLSGYTQLGDPLGMKFDAIIGPQDPTLVTNCSGNGALSIHSTEELQSVTILIAADTNYDQAQGTAASNYSFKGDDPISAVQETISAASAKSYAALLQDHTDDYQALQGAFVLELPDTQDSASVETKELISSYSYAATEGDPYLEGVLFDFGRHLLISSSRENSLPASLQGVWNERLTPSWGSDYHANINLQMNYWFADQTGLGATQDALWNYMANTWVPRGTETAKLLYNASGWVTHDEMNIFGHTAMKYSATWANYPAAAAWMMKHVWDSFEYTQDLDWLESQGYPLIKGVAEFWISQLQDDEFFNDGTLVVNPCNSPENGPTTFGCSHYQQEIHQVFESTLAAADLVSESDTEFVTAVSKSLEKLDKGLHFTSWGGIKEWKLPDSYGYDNKSTHRHLSHLTGWYPGYAVASYDGGYANETVQKAVEQTLIARGNGTGTDADAGWAKVWRAACWARLNNTEQAYFELRYAIDINFAANGLSMYTKTNAPFQIDANFGFVGAVLSMLVVYMPNSHAAKANNRTIVLGPAIPAAWANGSVKGLRLRGGAEIDFSWDAKGVVTNVTVKSGNLATSTIILSNINGTILGTL